MLIRLYCMMMRYHNVKAVSSPPESRFPVLRTQGVIGAGIFNYRADVKKDAISLTPAGEPEKPQTQGPEKEQAQADCF